MLGNHDICVYRKNKDGDVREKPVLSLFHYSHEGKNCCCFCVTVFLSLLCYSCFCGTMSLFHFSAFCLHFCCISAFLLHCWCNDFIIVAAFFLCGCTSALLHGISALWIHFVWLHFNMSVFCIWLHFFAFFLHLWVLAAFLHSCCISVFLQHFIIVAAFFCIAAFLHSCCIFALWFYVYLRLCLCVWAGLFWSLSRFCLTLWCLNHHESFIKHRNDSDLFQFPLLWLDALILALIGRLVQLQ